MTQRWPRSVYDVGTEPDPRLSMANERTALAWIRTSLAVVAAGIALTSLARLAGLTRGLDIVAALLCLLGVGLAANSVLGWRRREVALRTGSPLPVPTALIYLAAGVILIGAVLAVYLLTLAWR